MTVKEGVEDLLDSEAHFSFAGHRQSHQPLQEPLSEGLGVLLSRVLGPHLLGTHTYTIINHCATRGYV